MNYYIVTLRTISDFDIETKFENFKPINYGLELSYYPFDDIIEKDDKYFITERLSNCIFKESNDILKGIKVIDFIRVSKNSNWVDLYGDNCEPYKYLEIEIVGRPFEDDLGLFEIEITHPIVGKYKTKCLVISEKAAKKLILNHCPTIQGVQVTLTDINEKYSVFNDTTFNQKEYWLINQIKNF